MVHERIKNSPLQHVSPDLPHSQLHCTLHKSGMLLLGALILQLLESKALNHLNALVMSARQHRLCFDVNLCHAQDTGHGH